MPPQVPPGTILRHRLLDAESVYSVIRVEGEVVEVQALDVPGLPSGFRLKLAWEAVRAMEHEPAPAATPERERSREVKGELRRRPPLAT